jgi:transcriptional regulator with PAS, ATPase and Fis domain
MCTSGWPGRLALGADKGHIRQPVHTSRNDDTYDVKLLLFVFQSPGCCRQLRNQIQRSMLSETNIMIQQQERGSDTNIVKNVC